MSKEREEKDWAEPSEFDGKDELPAMERLSIDLAAAAKTMSDKEVRYLVDCYYILQDGRKRANSQLLAMGDEPHEVLKWFAKQSEVLESQAKRALDKYTQSHKMGPWMREVFGIGPVISAGLLAHIDINKAPTTGHIWAFAGLDPTKKWEKNEPRPWNASLRVICWKIGQSFMKFSNNDKCYYGGIYRERKAYEIARNTSGGNAARAAEILKEKNFKKTTEAYKHLSTGFLPPAQIDARARRYATKLFLAHLHDEWFRVEFGKEPPLPYAIAILGHAHLKVPPKK
jgi:hypothetical protein